MTMTGYLEYIYGIELLNKQNLAESIVQFEKARTEANLDYLVCSSFI